jgi:hypothetical protein
MRVLCSFVLCLSVVVLLAVGAEGKKSATNAEKIVGTWEFVKSKEKVPIPFGSTFTFAKDPAGQGRQADRDPAGQGRQTIKKLTNTELVIEDKNGYVLEFKRKAGEKVGK